MIQMIWLEKKMHLANKDHTKKIEFRMKIERTTFIEQYDVQ